MPLLVFVTFRLPFALEVFVPLGETPESEVPDTSPSLPPRVAVTRVDCAPEASDSAMASALGVVDVRDAGIVAKRDLLELDLALLDVVEMEASDLIASPVLVGKALFTIGVVSA